MKTKINPLYTAILLATATTTAVAQANEPVELQRSTVVSSASGFEQKITEAPASISVVDNEELEKKQYSNLAQALGDVEGLDIGQGTGKTGGLNISFRGMPSEYTLILIDGRRQNPAGNVTPNGFNETSTSFMPPMSAIERIEVIRGPMSTLYGSDAMGGVINIITKKVNPVWSGSVSADYTLQQHSEYGDSGGTSFYASGPLIENLVGLTVRGNYWDRDSSSLKFSDGNDVNPRGLSPVSGEKYNIGTRLDFTPSDNHDFALDFEKGRQKYDNNKCQLGTLDGMDRDCDSTSNSAWGYEDELKFERTQYALSHTGRFELGTLSNDITYNSTETLGRTIFGNTIGQSPNTTYLPHLTAGDSRTLESDELTIDSNFVANFLDNHITTIGGQYRHAELDDSISPDKFKQESSALFVENEWRFHPDWALTLGGRYEHHQAFSDHFSPRAYLVWNTTDNWTIKGGVSRGYKTPDLNALHNGINGATRQGQIITMGNPNLKPEKSTSTELAVYYDNLAGFDANATIFRNDFKDKISAGPDISCPYNTNNLCSQDLNIGKAVTQGIELAARWEFLENWSIRGNYTYTDSEQKSGPDKGEVLTNTPEHVANVSLNWDASDNLSLWLKNEYRGKRERFTSRHANLSDDELAIYNGFGSKTKAYTLVHLGGSYQATDALTFNATIYNLMDKNFARGKTINGNSATDYAHTGRSTTGGLEERRRLWLSATYKF